MQYRFGKTDGIDVVKYMKKSRNTLSFEPEQDVADMLKTAQEAGLTKGEIINEALKICGKEAIKKLAEKKTASLSTLSFFDAQLPLFGHLIAA